MASDRRRRLAGKGQICFLVMFLWSPLLSGQQLDCGPRGEAVEGGEHILTCAGLPAGQVVHWTKTHTLSGDLAIANCTAVSVCITDFPSLYEVSRPSDATSTLKIRNVTRDNDFVSGNWTCSLNASSSSCDVTVVYPPDHEGCEARFDVASGQVVGQCVLEKVYPEPTCSWSEVLLTGFVQLTPIPSSQTTLSVTQFVDSSNNQTYFQATCKLHRPLPVVEGSYTYNVLITPGQLRPSINFTSTNIIRLPASPQVASSCPVDYVTDVNAANCTCSTSDLGSPTGTLAWLDPDGRHVISSSTLSLTLPFADVSSAYNGRVYHCEVQHHTGSISVPYTPQIAEQPNKPTVSGLPDHGDLSPAQTLTLTCSAEGGHPGVTRVIFQCPGQADQPDSQEGGAVISRLTLTVSLADDGTSCTCYAENGYFTSETAVFPLKVSERSTKEDWLWILVGVLAAAVVLGLGLGATIALCKQKKKKRGHSKLSQPRDHQGEGQNGKKARSPDGTADRGCGTSETEKAKEGTADNTHMFVQAWASEVQPRPPNDTRPAKGKKMAKGKRANETTDDESKSEGWSGDGVAGQHHFADALTLADI